MVLLVLFVAVALSLSHWLLEPLLRGLTPGLSLTWLGWLGLALALWLLAGSRSDDPPARS